MQDRDWSWIEYPVHATTYCTHCSTTTSWRLIRIVKDTQGNLTAEGVFGCICCGKETIKQEERWTPKMS